MAESRPIRFQMLLKERDIVRKPNWSATIAQMQLRGGYAHGDYVGGSCQACWVRQDEDMSNFRACSLVFDCPRASAVNFARYNPHIVTRSPYKDGQPVF
jgi:hypothetical protein